MRILVLAPSVPFPVRTGGQGRTLGIVRCLAAFADVHVLAVGDPRDPFLPEAREQLARMGAGLEVHAATGPGEAETDAADVERLPDTAAHFRSPSLAAALAERRQAGWPDAVHVEELVMAQYAVGPPAVLDRQKVEWAYYEALAAGGGPQAEAHRREAARFRRWDANLGGRFAAVLVAGEADRALLGPFHRPIHVVPHGVDDRLRRPADRTSEVHEVLLYGALDYPPNAEANALYFRDVWPRLRAASSDLRTVVVGSGEPPDVIPRDDPRVVVRGFVEDVTSLLTGPAVLVAPLRVGGGARTKILEALAAGLPVVSTAVGVESLGLAPGRHYLEAATADETAAAVLRLRSDPALVRGLGTAGAERVDEAFRWSHAGRALEAIYRGLLPGRRGHARTHRALLIGVHPTPEVLDARALSFPGHRTAQFAAALAAAGCEVEAVLLDEEGDCAARPPHAGVLLVAPDAFRAGVQVQARHDAVDPDFVVAAGGYHTARAAARLVTRAPRWIDLPGDLAAEGQLRAARAGEPSSRDVLAVLAEALAAGDLFSVVGPSQRLALLGQLGLAGRLGGPTLGREPVAVVPLACEGPPAAPPLPAAGLTILWNGGYNTWMDEAVLLAALEEVLARREDATFVSIGGPVPGHEERRHGAFWSRVRRSALAARFHDHGRVPRREALALLAESHVVVCATQPCLEAELGSRQRLVEALAHGRPVVATDVGDLPRAIAARGAGRVVPGGDPRALAAALLDLAEDRVRLADHARAARALWETDATATATAAPLRLWAERPAHWPVAVASASARDMERLRLQSEIDHIRGSRTFRILRHLDRLLGRGGGRR